jgi:hypothetical protein
MYCLYISYQLNAQIYFYSCDITALYMFRAILCSSSGGHIVNMQHMVSSLSVSGRGVPAVDCVWNVMAHAQKPYFVFRRNGRVHLNRRWRQFSRILAAEVCASAVVMLDTPCSEVVWRVLANHSIRHFPLHFPSLASPCAITFQLDSTQFSLNLCTARTPRLLIESDDTICCVYTQCDLLRMSIVLLETCKGL